MVLMFMVVVVVVVVVVRVDVELHAFDGGFLFARGVQVIIVQVQLGELTFKLLEVNAEIEHCADEHIATDAAERIQI